MARLKQRLVSALSFAAPSGVSGGLRSAIFAARSIRRSSRGTAETDSDVSSASAPRKSPSRATASSAASAASTAARRDARDAVDSSGERLSAGRSETSSCHDALAAFALAKRSTSADITSSRVTGLEASELETSSAPLGVVSSSVSFSVAPERIWSDTSASTSASAAPSFRSRAARFKTPRALRRFASSPATSTGTCRHAAVIAAASAEASAARASARISASIASASPPDSPPNLRTASAPASAPTARASAMASSSATYPAPCGCLLAASNARRTFSLASFRFTDLPSRMRVRFSMRTRSASRSALAGRPLATARASESSIHSVSTTNGTPSSRSVSAAFTMPSPSDSAAVSFPGALTFTITTKRRSPLFSFVVDDAVDAERYETSDVTFSRSYVPNEYGPSGQSFSKNKPSDSASTWFRRVCFSSLLASSELSSAGVGFRGSKICTPAPELGRDPDPGPSSWALDAVARIPAAALSAAAVINTARSVIAVVGCVQPSHSGNANRGPSESFMPYASYESFAESLDRDPAEDDEPAVCFRAERAPMAASELGGPSGLARSSGTGTCMATLGLSPTATLSTGNEVTSATMASCTSRITRSVDVLVSRCHCSMLSRKSTRAPGTTSGGAGAW